MQTLQGFKSGQGWMIALLILAGLDIMIGSIGALFMFQAPPSDRTTMEIGIAGMVLLLQFPLRCISLAVAMRWTWRLVANGHRQTTFPVSTLWAWLSYIVPVAAFWLPLKTLLALNGKTLFRRMLIWTWWLVRLTTTTVTGPFLVVFCIAIAAVIIGESASERVPGLWMDTLVLGGLIARALEIAVITLTQAHQPRAQVVAATVF